MTRLRKGDVPRIEGALAQLATVVVRAPTAVRIAQLTRRVVALGEELRGERDRLVAEHAARDEDGAYVPASDPAMREQGMITIAPAEAAALEEALARLLDETVEIPVGPLSSEDLRREDGRPVDIPAATLLGLGPLFRDPDDTG